MVLTYIFMLFIQQFKNEILSFRFWFLEPCFVNSVPCLPWNFAPRWWTCLAVPYWRGGEHFVGIFLGPRFFAKTRDWAGTKYRFDIAVCINIYGSVGTLHIYIYIYTHMTYTYIYIHTIYTHTYTQFRCMVWKRLAMTSKRICIVESWLVLMTSMQDDEEDEDD